MALFAKNVPKRCRKTFETWRNAKQLIPRVNLWVAATGLCNAAKVALYIGHKNRYAAAAEFLCQPLERHGLPRSGSARYHTVPVCHLRQQTDLSRVMFCR